MKVLLWNGILNFLGGEGGVVGAGVGGLKLALRDPNLPFSLALWLKVKTYICLIRVEVLNSSINHYGHQIDQR